MSRMFAVFVAVVLTVVTLHVGSVEAVNHTMFKTCSQSSFCRRSRSLEPGTSEFQVVTGTRTSNETSVQFVLAHATNSQQFDLTVVALASSTFRVQIDEKTPLMPRYRIEDALKGEPVTQKITSITEATSGDVTIVVGTNKLVVIANPFRLDFYENDVLVVTANGKGLMRFEYLRTKPTTVDPTSTAIEDTDPGSWTETFNGFTDTKPRGPEAIALDFGFPQAKVLFGIPLHADSFALKSTTTTTDTDPYRLYNLDVAYHEVDSKMALYGAVPVLYGHGASRTAGIFWHNAAETWVDIYASGSNSTASPATANFMAESGIIDVFVMLGPRPKDVFRQYTDLTGVVPLPQEYTLAYHQCRWNYDNQSDVVDVAAGFDTYDIPLDTMWLDIEYTDQKKYFTWNPTNFSNPSAMIANLTASSRHLTVIVDIHLKRDSTYSVNADCIAQDLYTKTVAGVDFIGECWPGQSSYPDVFRQAPRDYLSTRYSLQNFPDTTENVMIWNDMNEPSVFDGPESTMPKDNLHLEGSVEHRALHNQFGHMQLRSTFKGLSDRSSRQQRPFILTRSHFAGSHRYAIIWTGDNTAEFAHLQVSIKECLAEAVAGFSFCGADVGGFFGHPSDELFERWFQAAAFTPFYRSHANMGTPRREPWMFPNATLQRVRAAIKRRYTYLPFWYTMFYEHQRMGLPVMRPLLTQYPDDEATFSVEDAFMLSDVLMVSPVVVEGATSKSVYFPSDVWYDVDDYVKYNVTAGFRSIAADRDKAPVFQRGGTILPRRMQPKKASPLMVNDPYTLVVCVNNSQSAAGSLYIDDGKSYAYETGNYIYARFTYADRVLSSMFVDANTTYPTTTVVEQIVIVGLDWIPTGAAIKTGSVSGEFTVTASGNAFVLALPNVKMVEEWSIQFSGAGSVMVSLVIWPLVAVAVWWRLE